MHQVAVFRVGQLYTNDDAVEADRAAGGFGDIQEC